MFQNVIIEVVLTVKKLEMFTSVMLQELGLAIDSFVVLSEESIDEHFVLGSDAFESVTFNVTELGNHLFINFEINCSVCSLVAEGFASHTSEGEESGHAEGGVYEYSQVTSQLFSIHGSHRCGYDKVWL